MRGAENVRVAVPVQIHVVSEYQVVAFRDRRTHGERYKGSRQAQRVVLHLGVVLLSNGLDLQPLRHDRDGVVVVFNVRSAVAAVIVGYAGVAHQTVRDMVDVAVTDPCVMLEVGLHLHPARL